MFSSMDIENNSETIPLLGPKKSEEKTSNTQTLLHILKCNIGPGILALPMAIKHGGWCLGPFCLLFIGTLSIHCMDQLFQASRNLKAKGYNVKDYGCVAKAAFQEYGPDKVKEYAFLVED
jgi:proton-coupled amino acid transporter